MDGTNAAGGAPPSSVHIPLSFVSLEERLDPDARFFLRYGDQDVWIGDRVVTLASGRSARGETSDVVRLRFVGSDPSSRAVGRDRLRGVANFFYGQDPEQWRSGVATFGRVALVDLYPGIQQVYFSSGQRLKSELRLAAGADPAEIHIAYEGHDALAIAPNGDLLITTSSGAWRETAPVAYQEIDGRRVEVEAEFRLVGPSDLGFTLGRYDANHELIIDPMLRFSTFLGGDDSDSGTSIAVDDDGNVLVCGGTRSTNFPLENPANGMYSDNTDLFLAKLDFTGSVLLYSTYLGGTGRELGGDLAVDPAGNAYCVGWTASADFPTTQGVSQPTFSGGADDAAVVKLGPSGNLLLSTYLGGLGDDQPEDLAVTADGRVFIVGNTDDPLFPTTMGPSHAGSWDVFVTQLDQSFGSPLLYSRFLGGAGYDEPMALALDDQDSAYVVGRTQSMGFPTTPGSYDQIYDGTDTAFLSKLSPDGSTLVYSTFLDGISPRSGHRQLAVAVDSDGQAHVAAPSEGSGFPPTPNAYDGTFDGPIDTVVMKVNATGTGLIYSTFFGGSSEDRPNDIAIDSHGSVYITGSTSSTRMDGFPLVDPLDDMLDGPTDAFLARLDPDGKSLSFSTYLGGSDLDSARGIALGPTGPCLTGDTASMDFPTFPPSPPPLPVQPNFGGGTNDAFVTCLDAPNPCPGQAILSQEPNGVCVVISDRGNPSSVAENFVLGPLHDVRLTQVRFTGVYWNSNTYPGSDAFEVNLYDGSLGLPGPAPIAGCSETSIAPSSRVDTLRDFGPLDVFELTLDLSGSCQLTAGGTYWIEIFETGTAPDDFAWECGATDPVHGAPGSARASQAPGTQWMGGSNELALVLIAEEDGCGTEPCLAPPPGMTYWAPFDETLGVVSADLVAGNNGDHLGAALPVPGRVAGAIELDGGHVSVPDAPELDFGTDNFAIDFWIQELDGPPLGTVLAKYDAATQRGFELFWDIIPTVPASNGLYLRINSESYYLQYAVDEGKVLPWTHMVISVDRTQQLIFFSMDGVLFNTETLFEPPSISISNDEPMLIGKAMSFFADFSGKLDELELFRRLLTSQEAQSLFEASVDGKCKDNLSVPWDRPYCLNDDDRVVSIEVCNYSTTTRIFELTFSPLPALPTRCTVAGPTSFSDPVTGNPPPLAVQVPAQMCVQRAVRIERPQGFMAHGDVACYQVTRTDTASGGTRISEGSVQDTRNTVECAQPLPADFEVALSRTRVVLPGDNAIELQLEVENPTPFTSTLDFRVEAMVSDMTSPQTGLSLDGQAPGLPVDGMLEIPPGDREQVRVTVRNVGVEPFSFHDLVLSTREQGTSDDVPLVSTALRAPLATETIVANPDRVTATGIGAVVIDVLVNDFGLSSGLDPATLQIVSPPAHGLAEVIEGSITYRPNEEPSSKRIDVLIYEICTLDSNCADAVVGLTVLPEPVLAEPIFMDGFESGDTSRWSATAPLSEP
ncbi:MAG: SBBP repeat-containing protein [Acidobacteriota bacterium]